MEAQNKSGKTLRVNTSIEIEASARDVFNAWIDTSLLSQWMFGSHLRDERIVKLACDAREGGKFSFVVERQGKEINHVGTYREVQSPRRLVFTWGIEGESDGDESVVTIDITPQGNGCRVELTHDMDPKWEAYLSRTEQGWRFMLGKLKEVLE